MAKKCIEIYVGAERKRALPFCMLNLDLVAPQRKRKKRAQENGFVGAVSVGAFANFFFIFHRIKGD